MFEGYGILKWLKSYWKPLLGITGGVTLGPIAIPTAIQFISAYWQSPAISNVAHSLGQLPIIEGTGGGSQVPAWADSVKVWASMGTLAALTWAIWSWQLTILRTKKSMINAIFEEIRHNLNIAESLFVNKPKEVEVKFLYTKIRATKPKAIYPNPTDSEDNLKEMVKGTYFKDRPKVNPRSYLMLMRMNSLQDIVTKGDAVHLLGKRLFLNVHHLFYSINRFNEFVKHFNNLVQKSQDPPEVERAFEAARNEYLVWLHYRLWFALLDLIESVPKNKIIDSKYVEQLTAAGKMN